jgi:hypothetical protein
MSTDLQSPVCCQKCEHKHRRGERLVGDADMTLCPECAHPYYFHTTESRLELYKLTKRSGEISTLLAMVYRDVNVVNDASWRIRVQHALHPKEGPSPLTAKPPSHR